jgi:hypothetical protein
MANAGPMINTCFRHQHPEFYGRPEIAIPDEAWTTRQDEQVPVTSNSEGYVPTDQEPIAWA